MDDFGRAFQFEEDYANSLRCIPMAVRYKLDACGIKLKLKHWLRFNDAERKHFLERPCRTPAEIAAYRQALMDGTSGQDEPAGVLPPIENPPWEHLDSVPSDLLEKSRCEGISLSREQWAALTALQRYALMKLSRPGHENRNFRPAASEFGLLHE